MTSTQGQAGPSLDNFTSSNRAIQLLLQAGSQAVADFDRAVSSIGLTPNKARALLLLEEAHLAKDLAAVLGCDRSYITGLTASLEKEQLITRAPGADRRQKLISLTPAGHIKLQEVKDVLVAQGLPVHRLTERERAQLSVLLEKIL